MFKLVSFSISFILMLIIALVMPLSSQESKPKHAPNTLPGVEEEMLSPDYWISLHDDVDKTIMTPLEIERFNTMIEEKKKFYIIYMNEDYLYSKNYREIELNDKSFFDML